MSEARYPFTEVSREEAVETCRRLHRLGHAWHIHALSPQCRFSHRPGQYCFMVEDTDEGRTWCAFSDSHFRAECQELVRLLHGEAILDAAARPSDFVEPEILASVRDCVRAGESWHHHMMKPGCVLSPSPECHVITLERSSTDTVEVFRSDTPPDHVLREIELLYFS